MNREREFLRLAAVALACRYQIMTGLWLGPPWPQPSGYDALGYGDYTEEMRLLCVGKTDNRQHG